MRTKDTNPHDLSRSVAILPDPLDHPATKARQHEHEHNPHVSAQQMPLRRHREQRADHRRPDRGGEGLRELRQTVGRPERRVPRGVVPCEYHDDPVE